MCGVVGFLSSRAADWGEPVVQRMAQTILKRGPDAGGYWVDREGGAALGHRRLAVVDLSEAGHQPMHSTSGRYVIAFNGEIYNHLGLRAELQACAPVAWRGHSDTETLLAGFEAWGVEAMMKKCIGMFALATWDKKTRSLTLGRDRLGEKPLYYGWQGEGEGAVFLFGSELKALKAHPSFAAPVCRKALTLYMRLGYVPAPLSIYEGIGKLLPGHLLTVRPGDRTQRVQAYWNAKSVVEQNLTQPFSGTPAQAVDALELL